ncbi:hypothetical protein AYO21_09730 [Fonsecaea monophora]|uniref:Uncharacterized protein n=1 Tax=Fonsecaea monophora TaxID=254056 RepID=A0A177EVN9_9EURO|nr:hypothetical protein AYO21_09730 [Fonsecaea monophora]OAG36103.1 hypothetical protein AYO21_09730 [Fonsecaea monophora]
MTTDLDEFQYPASFAKLQACDAGTMATKLKNCFAFVTDNSWCNGAYWIHGWTKDFTCPDSSYLTLALTGQGGSPWETKSTPRPALGGREQPQHNIQPNKLLARSRISPAVVIRHRIWSPQLLLGAARRLDYNLAGVIADAHTSSAFTNRTILEATQFTFVESVRSTYIYYHVARSD